MRDIVADLLNAANGYANKEAELLEAAASEIDLLRDELADCKRISSAAVGHQGSLLEAANAERKALKAQNADLLAALQIVKEQRQLWWGKAVDRGRELHTIKAQQKD